MGTFCAIVFALLSTLGRVLCGRHERALIRNLTTEYIKYARPVEKEDEAVTVRIGFDLQQIIDIDEKNQIIIINVWLKLEWHDYTMRWDPLEYGNVTEIRLPSSMVWTPDILLYNSANDEFDSMYPANVVVLSNGSMSWIPPGIIRASCKIDIKWFPFDDQKCVLKFGSWTYDMKAIDLLAGHIERGTYIENGEWQLVDIIGTRHQYPYACCPNPFVDVTFTLWTRRRTLYYGFNLIIPCVLISSMVLLGFTLPPDCGEKLTLGVTIFMSLCVFLLMVAEAMPQTSDAVPLIEIYFSCIMIVVTASVVFTVLVQNFHFRHPSTHVMPKMFRTVLLQWLPWMLMMERPAPKPKPHRMGMSGSSSTEQCAVVQSSTSLLPDNDHYYVRKQQTPFRPSAQKHPEANNLLINAMNEYAAVQSNRALATARHPPVLRAMSPPMSSPPHSDQGPLMDAIWAVLEEIRYITDKMRDEELELDEVSDWKFAAMVVDRVCLILFTAFMIASTCAVLFAAPHLLS